MPKDIRSYFSSLGAKKSDQTETNLKRKAIPLSSDEEESTSKETKSKDKAASRQQSKKTKKTSSKKRRIIDSDDEVQATPPPVRPNKKPNLHKLKEVPDEKLKTKEIEPFFNDIPKRVERKPAEYNLLEGDDEFDRSVINIDEKEILEKLVESHNKTPSIQVNGMALDETKPSESKADKSSNSNKKSPVREGKSIKSDEKSPLRADISPKSSSKRARKEDFSRTIEITANETSEKKRTPKKKANGPGTSKQESATKAKNSLSELMFDEKEETQTPNTTPRRKSEKKFDQESSGLSDEDRHERKRLAAILYQKFKNRQSVLNPGSKEIPEGKPNCLAGSTFLVTGILDSLERDEANDLIKKLGGKVSTTVGKRLNYMVVGQEAGPKKLATAEELGVTILSEDGLLDLIREKSGEPVTATSTTVIKKEKKLTPEKCKIEKNDDVMKNKKRIKNESPKKVNHVDIKKAKITNMIVDNEPKSSNDDAIIKNVENLAWVEKYKPTDLKQIIGQQGASSNVVKLKNWLSKWYTNHDGTKKPQKPNPWAKNDDGSYYKAALLSGPPGVGKTTSANLVCKELGFDIVEFNASDTRSKRLLKEEVSELLSNKSLYGYFHEKAGRVTKKHALLMDEVDGMAGNEDRGGIQELISLIKDSSVPIICMCNDRNHPKMRSLVNYCYDLRFSRPRLEQIKGAMMSICYKEKIKLPPQKIEEIISASNHDIRQTINFLAMLSAGKDLNLDENKNYTAKKDLKLGPWDVVRKVFSAEEHKHMTINDKSDLFFNDYSLGPLFVQQNYLQVMPKVPKDQIPLQVAKAADSLSLGDLVEKRIRNNSAWTLLPVQAMFSSVLPGEYMAGHITGQINFPAWLGKNSKRTKRSKLAQEIHNHTRIRTSGSRLSIRLDYAPFLLDAIVRPLKNHGLDGVVEALEVIKEYRLLREDLEALVELTSWPGKKNPMDSIEGKVKAALTRAYNKEVLAYSYSAVSGVKKKRAEANDDVDLDLLEDGDGVELLEEEEDEEDDKLENDALIKAKKKTTKASTSSEPSTSKGGGKSSKGAKAERVGRKEKEKK